MKKFIIIIIIIAIAIAGFIMLSSDEQPTNDYVNMEQIPRNDTADKIISDLDEIDTTDIEAELDSDFNAIDAELLNL